MATQEEFEPCKPAAWADKSICFPPSEKQQEDEKSYAIPVKSWKELKD